MHGSCLVVEADKTLIEHCFFQRSGNQFNVYYPGPEHSKETVMIDYYKNKLQLDNEFKNNIVLSSHDCDNVSFSLQKNGKVVDNKIQGKLAAYMLKDCNIINNHITNSKGGEGLPLFVSLPAENVTIKRNTLISDYENKAGAACVIRVDIQKDNKQNLGEIPGGKDKTIADRIKTSTKIIVKNNDYEMNTEAKFIHQKYQGNLNENCLEKKKNTKSPIPRSNSKSLPFEREEFKHEPLFGKKAKVFVEKKKKFIEVFNVNDGVYVCYNSSLTKISESSSLGKELEKNLI